MNKRQTIFVEHKAATGNSAESAREADYALSDDGGARAGHQVMRSTEVQEAVARRIAEAEVEVRLTPEYVLSALMTVVEIGLANGNLPAVTQAATQLGRKLQLFTDRLDIGLIDARMAEMAEDCGLSAAEVEEAKRMTLNLLAPPKQLR